MKNVFTGESITIDYDIERVRFCLGPSQFDDFNNLSMVNFYFYGGIGIVFPGDLQKKAGENYYKIQASKNALKNSHIDRLSSRKDRWVLQGSI